jgi:serine/threonine protein kinase
MAPEQTGRMNRSVDSQSDLYALGISRYQVLTGALPFTASNPMEWIHCHSRGGRCRQAIPRALAAAQCERNRYLDGVDDELIWRPKSRSAKYEMPRHTTAACVSREMPASLSHIKSSNNDAHATS